MKHNLTHFGGQRVGAKDVLSALRADFPKPWRLHPFVRKGRCGLMADFALAAGVHNRRTWMAPSWGALLAKVRRQRDREIAVERSA